LRPLEIFSGKLLGAVLLTEHVLIGTLPFLAVSFLAGGVPALQFVGALVTLVNVLLFCVAVGLLASVVSQEAGQAQIAAVASAACLAVATPAIHVASQYIAGTPVLPQGWLTLSPLYAPYFVLTGFTGGTTQLFWAACGATLVYSLMALLTAAVVLQRTWRESPDEFARRTPGMRWLNWLRGDGRWRAGLRKQLLNQHPFAWLAARDRRFVLAAKLYVLAVALAWAAIVLVRGNNGAVLTIFMAVIASILLHQGLNWFLAYSAALALSEERRTGGFEVLLTTSLPVEQIIGGQHRALMLQFKSVLKATMALDAVLAISVIMLRPWWWLDGFWIGAGWMLWMAGWTVAHRVTPSMAMWVGTWTGRPAYAALVALRPVFLLMLTFMPVKSPQVLMDKLTRELRLIACAPVPARGDARFAGWNPEEIFPPGRWGELKLREGKSARPEATRTTIKRNWSRHMRLLPARRRKERF
jgi:hypothetical protein